jgi:hypothetical protein
MTEMKMCQRVTIRDFDGYRYKLCNKADRRAYRHLVGRDKYTLTVTDTKN